jgi:tubulin beta
MSIKFWKVVRDETASTATASVAATTTRSSPNQLVLPRGLGRQVRAPRGSLELEPGVISAVRASPLGEHFRPVNLVNQNACTGNSWAKGHFTKAWHEFC